MRRLTVGLLLLTACGGESTPPPTTSGPTYHAAVAPILAEHCLACHSGGGVSQLPLNSYATASGAAAAIADATSAGRMPPWHVDDACRSFSDGPTITDAQIALLGDWFEAGAPEGETAPPPKLPPLDSLEDVTVTLDPGVAYDNVANDDDDDYRCFIVDAGLTSDQFLTAYQVHPGVERLVHHVVLYAVADAAEAAEVEALDAQDPGPGYRCYGGAGTLGARSLAVWAPGTQVTRYPAGTGLRVEAGLPLVMQLHYSSGGEPDRTTMDLHLEPSVDKEAIVTGVFDTSLELPPGMESVTQTAALPIPPLDRDLELYGIYPHMHARGRKVNAFYDRGGDSTCLVDVPRYDPDWQRYYFYETPVVIEPPGGGFFRIECDFDTRGATAPITWGEDADDEMCIAAIYATY